MMESLIAYDPSGNYVFIWTCTCGRKGSGSPSDRQEMTGFKRHIQKALRREAY
ncbi:hypothetical protein [Demequina sediminicola]|uniref:hypothetical protein n=1 Tax=Demequina sediminicola TaxID=1095026 RepID=UPI000A3F01CB|nr:hypothetical protein [Demequina sediminicola]